MSYATTKSHLRWVAGTVAGSALCAGCSIISPVPLWELTKGTAALASVAIPYGSSEASQTVYHQHRAFSHLCIEYNPDAPIADVVPALQIELRRHQIDSLVYPADTSSNSRLSEICPVWLMYRAEMEWGVPPMQSDYQPYVTVAALTLRSAEGRVLASSQYQLSSISGIGKWASTQRKLSPAVKAILTGFQN